MSVVAVTRGHHYVVSTGHELATLAAFEVLDNGGNAIDAGVAAILALEVVYSEQVSVAGVAPMIIRLAETGEVITIAGVGGWPRALDPDAFIARHRGSIPLGVRRTVVPAAPDACLQALERWGTMTFREVARRAVHYASKGFARHPVMLDYLREYSDDMRHWPDNVAIWMPGDKVPEPGDRLVQADLGRVLQSCVTRSAQPPVTAGPGSKRYAKLSTVATSPARFLHTNVLMTDCSRPRTWKRSAARWSLQSRAGFVSTVRRSRSTPVARGARDRSCSRRSPSRRRPGFRTWNTVRMPTCMPSPRSSS